MIGLVKALFAGLRGSAPSGTGQGRSNGLRGGMLRRLPGIAATVAGTLTSPALIAPLLLVGGPAALVYGVLLLAGPGWSAVSGGLLAMVAGVVLSRGGSHE